MNPLAAKPNSLSHSLAALILAAVSAVALLFCYISPVVVADQTLNALLNAALPRFFIAAILFVVAYEFFYDCLIFYPLSRRNWLWCMPLFLVVIVNFPFSALIGGTARLVRANLVWLFLIKCLFIGLSEELLFRGIVLRLLLDCFENKKGACFFPVLISSAVFALFHFINLIDGAGILPVLQQVGYSFLIGAMLAVLFVKTKNLWLCVILHALFDFGGFLIGDLGSGSPHDLTFWILTVVVGVLCAVHVVAALIKQKRP